MQFLLFAFGFSALGLGVLFYQFRRCKKTLGASVNNFGEIYVGLIGIKPRWLRYRIYNHHHLSEDQIGLFESCVEKDNIEHIIIFAVLFFVFALPTPFS